MANSKKKSAKGSKTSKKKKTGDISKTRLSGVDDNNVIPSPADLINENSHEIKKVYKFKSELFNKESTWTYDPNLDKLKGKVLAPKKLAEANKMLRNLKTPLPK
jgi:hypothetical protein